MYLQAAGGAGYLQITVEIDRATAAAPRMGQGRGGAGRGRPGRRSGAAERQVETITLEAGKRVYSPAPTRRATCWRRGAIRCGPRSTAQGARMPLTLSHGGDRAGQRRAAGLGARSPRAAVPAPAALFEPTADARFRRTERLVVETPLIGGDATVTARLLNRVGPADGRAGRARPSGSTRALQQRVSLAEVVLAPLAPGEYVVEVTRRRGHGHVDRDATGSGSYPVSAARYSIVRWPARAQDRPRAPGTAPRRSRWPIASSPCRNGTALPIACNAAGWYPAAQADQHREQDAGQRAAGDQPRAEQRAGAEIRFAGSRRSCARPTSARGRRRRSAPSSRSADTRRRRTTASGCRTVRASPTTNTPTSTRPHGRFCDSRPLMSVAISVACGAATACRADAEHAGACRARSCR